MKSGTTKSERAVRLAVFLGAVVLAFSGCDYSGPVSFDTGYQDDISAPDDAPDEQPMSEEEAADKEAEADIPDRAEAPEAAAQTPPETNHPLHLVEKAKPAAAYSLTKTDVIDASDRHIAASQNCIFELEDDLTVHLLNAKGVDKLGKAYSGAQALGDGLYTVSAGSDDVNCVGLVTSDGEELIPCEAAIILRIRTASENVDSSRYLKVIYATGVVSDSAQAFFYVTENQLSMGPVENDIMYSGYARVYDLAEKRFVDGVSPDSNKLHTVICGEDYIYLDNENKVYAADGTVAVSFGKAYSDCGNGFMLAHEPGEYRTFSPTGEVLHIWNNDSDENLKAVYLAEGDSQYVKVMYQDLHYVLCDRFGNQVLDGSFTDITRCYDGVAAVKTDSEFQLLTLTGDVLFSQPYAPDTYPRADYAGYGYWTVKIGDQYWIVANDGRVADMGETYVSSPFDTKKHVEGDFGEDDKYIYFAPGKMEYSLETVYSLRTLDMPKGLGVCMINSARYAVCDMISGTQLLPADYTAIAYADGMIWANNGSQWEIYRAEVLY